MAYRWEEGEEVTADLLNRTGGVAEIVLPTDSLSDINTRIAQAESQGGGGVLFRSGTYTFSGDLIVKPTVSLIGESFGGVILDFDNNSAGVVMEGTDAYETGTISISSGTTVTGSGTSWSANVTAGQKIWIRGAWYTIASVTSDTELEIASSYTDVPVSGVSYAIATTFNNQRIENIFVQNSAGNALSYKYTETTLIDGMRFLTNNISISMEYSSIALFNNIDIFGGNAGIRAVSIGLSSFNNYNIQSMAQMEGFYMENCYNSKSFVGVVNNGASYGVRMKDSYGMAWTGFSNNNAKDGFYIENTDASAFNNCNATSNTKDGILIVDSDNISIVQGAYRYNTEYGISIDADSDNTVISACSFTGNTSGEIDDNGTDTVIRGASPALINNGGWKLIDSWTHSTNVTEVDFTDLPALDSFLVVAEDITTQYRVHGYVSEDNGSTFLGTDKYVHSGIVLGNEIPLARGDSKLCFLQVDLCTTSSGKVARSGEGTTDSGNYGIISTAPVNAIRITGGGAGQNITAGTIKVYGWY